MLHKMLCKTKKNKKIRIKNKEYGMKEFLNLTVLDFKVATFIGCRSLSVCFIPVSYFNSAGAYIRRQELNLKVDCQFVV